jgi:hypothetical protein
VNVDLSPLIANELAAIRQFLAPRQELLLSPRV